MPQDRRDRPSDVPWPPLIYSAAVLIAWTLEQYDRFVWLDSAVAMAPMEAGLGLIALGLVVDIWAMATLWRAKTTILPNAGTRSLVTKGPYRFSRNPIYIGNAVALIGLGITLRWGWLILLVPVVMAAVGWLAVANEEVHLERRFGDEWRAYARKVRRWL